MNNNNISVLLVAVAVSILMTFLTINFIYEPMIYFGNLKYTNIDNLTANGYDCYLVCDHMICENKTNSSDCYSCNIDGSYCVRGDW